MSSNQPAWLQDDTPVATKVNPISAQPSNTPSWAEQQSSSSAQDFDNGGKKYNSNSHSSQNDVSSAAGNNGCASWIKHVISFFNVGLMVLMASAGALGMKSVTEYSESGVHLVFVGFYMVLFSCILGFFEIAQYLPISCFDNWIKRNFGFLYGPFGKAAFLVFAGILCFGLSTPRKFGLASGVLVTSWGFISALVYMKWPELHDAKEKFDPTKE
jgi:hypothetical protein